MPPPSPRAAAAPSAASSPVPAAPPHAAPRSAAVADPGLGPDRADGEERCGAGPRRPSRAEKRPRRRRLLTCRPRGGGGAWRGGGTRRGGAGEPSEHAAEGLDPSRPHSRAAPPPWAAHAAPAGNAALAAPPLRARHRRGGQRPLLEGRRPGGAGTGAWPRGGRGGPRNARSCPAAGVCGAAASSRPSSDGRLCVAQISPDVRAGGFD